MFTYSKVFFTGHNWIVWSHLIHPGTSSTRSASRLEFQREQNSEARVRNHQIHEDAYSDRLGKTNASPKKEGRVDRHTGGVFYHRLETARCTSWFVP